MIKRRVSLINWQGILGALFGGLSLAFGVSLLATSAWLISTASTRPPILTLEVAVVMVRFFALGRAALRYLERVISHDALFNQLTKRRSALFRALEAMTPSPLYRGKILDSVVNESEREHDVWIRGWLPWSSALMSSLAGIGILYWLAPRAALIAIATTLVGLSLIPLISWKMAIQSITNAYRSDVEIAEHITQLCDLALESSAFNFHPDMSTPILSSRRNENASIRGVGIGTFFVQILTLITILGTTLIADSLFESGKLAGVNIAVLILLPLAIFEGIFALPSTALAYAQGRIAHQHIDQIINSSNESMSGVLKKKEFSLLEVKNLQVSWGNGLVPTVPISFTLRAGEKLLLSSESGSGKSSIGLAIAGLVPYTGSIAFDGIEVRDIADPYQLVSYEPQDPYIFATSLLENLRIGDQSLNRESAIALLQKIGLSELLNQVENIDQNIGIDFSGGEIKRIALSRRFLTNAPLLILDEPLESVDLESQKSIKDMLLRDERAMLLLSHHEISQIPTLTF